MFSNASSVVIGGKEVQSIKITSNNAVIYEKSSGGQTVSSVSLATNHNIISSLHSESVTLTATVTDSNSSPIANETVEFFKGNTSLGTATTNASGVATKSYSAVGSGDVSFNATASNVSSSSVTVKDAIYYNSGGDSNKLSDFDTSNIWTSKNTPIGTWTVTTDGEWLTIARSGSTSNYGFIPISLLTGTNVAIKVSMIADSRDSSGYNGWYNENYYVTLSQDSPFRTVELHTGSSDGWSVKNNQSQGVGVYKHIITYNGRSYSHTLYDLNNTQLKTHSWTMRTQMDNTSNTLRYGISVAEHSVERIYKIKELLVEPL